VPPGAAPTPVRAALRAWRVPLLAGAVSAAVLVAGFAVVLPRLARPKSPRPAELLAPEDLLDQVAEGRRALAAGRFRRARQVLNEAVAARDRQPDLLDRAQHRRLNQLQRQADLLARLSTRSLEEILRQAALVGDPDEWAAQFSDYRGKTVLFDDKVVLGTDDRPALESYVVRVNNETARVALEDLTLLQHLPLGERPRLLFGARLARCGREQGGAWVVRLEPDSAVLLTDPGAAAAAFVPASPDPELGEVLRRQEEWLRDVPGLRPAPE
jgi:hypothetical protein